MKEIKIDDTEKHSFRAKRAEATSGAHIMVLKVQQILSGGMALGKQATAAAGVAFFALAMLCVVIHCWNYMLEARNRQWNRRERARNAVMPL